MKTELRMRPHTTLPEQTVIELWWEGQFIGQVTGTDGPGVRVLSKYPMLSSHPMRQMAEVAIDVAAPPVKDP